MRRPAIFLLAAMALLASFLEHDRQTHPQLLINLIEPQRPAAQPVIAVDPVARMKFLNVDAKMIDAISYVNRFVNANMKPMSDKEQYGREDLWVEFPTSGKGDCEDFALAKYGILSEAGFPPMLMRVVGLIIHKDDGTMEGHGILELLLPDGSHAFLDNLHANVMTKAELEADGYEFVPWGD